MAAPAVPIPPPGGGSTPAPAGATVSSRWVKVAGFVVTGGALVLLADYAPQFALGTALLIGLGVALTHTAEINSLVSTWRGALGQ